VVSGQLEDSLRQEIESYIEGRISGIKQEIAALQSQLNESIGSLLDRQGEIQLDGSVAASILEHLRAAHEEGINLAASESARTRASSDMAIVKAAITEIDEQDTQADILKILVNRSASFAPRVAFFVIKGEQANGWRARGFDGTIGDSAVQQISVPLSADTIISEAARSHETWSGGPSSHSEEHLILNRLGEEAPQRLVSVPLTVRNRTVAVLYADSAGLDAEAIKLEALETLVRVSGMAVEMLTLSRFAAKPAAEPEPPHATVEPQREPEPESEPESAYTHITPEPEPEPQSAYAPVTEYAEVPPAPPEPEPVAPQPHALEAEQATPESVQPQPVAESSVDEVGPMTISARRRYGMDVELPVDVTSEEERRLHNDARRFARLLVSEIKLYNEQKVTEGRQQHDLYDRLREYIDRSREMYDRRVKHEVAVKYDYFHHELVNTLAEGDVANLGEAYPGATVSA
jgi:hypothetical protein